MSEPAAEAPLAFVSHASEDKVSFAEPLARALAVHGVRPWLDKWEIKPGDSLVQKLFDEGLARCQAIIVIVSTQSVTKRWVREELDSATVRRIEDGTRLIAVRLDDVDMPSPLRHLLWIGAERTTQSIQQTAERIADTLHGHDPRPAVAAPPAYTTVTAPISGLNQADAILLAEIIREAIRAGQTVAVDWSSVKSRVEQTGLKGEALVESVHALAELDYIDVHFRSPGHVTRLRLNQSGYAAGIEAVVPDVEEVYRRVIAALVNRPPVGNRALHKLAVLADTEELVVDQLLHGLEGAGYVTVSRAMGSSVRIHSVSPTLRRLLT